jgi:hypothetical protein
MARRLHQSISQAVLSEQQNELLADLLKLSVACPFDQTNPQDCPLSRLRRMKMAKRSRWLHALTEEDLAYLAGYHRVCLTVKIEPGLAEGQRDPA